MTAAGSILETLRASGALKEGHFVLSSGRHSDQYIEKFDLLRQPGRPRRSAGSSRIASEMRRSTSSLGPRQAASSSPSKWHVSWESWPPMPNDRRTATGREFRRGTTFSPGARVLVVDDILTTGGSLRDTRCACKSPC